MFSFRDLLGSHFEYFGFAAAQTVVRAFKDALIPALLIEIVCCSRTS